MKCDHKQAVIQIGLITRTDFAPFATSGKGMRLIQLGASEEQKRGAIGGSVIASRFWRSNASDTRPISNLNATGLMDTGLRVSTESRWSITSPCLSSKGARALSAGRNNKRTSDYLWIIVTKRAKTVLCFVTAAISRLAQSMMTQNCLNEWRDTFALTNERFLKACGVQS